LPSGKATLNLLKMAKAGDLLFELQRVLDEAKTSGEARRRDNVQFEQDGRFGSVSLEVIPFRAPLQQQSFIITFDGGAAPRQETLEVSAAPPDSKDKQIAQLKRELNATKEYLQ